MASGRDKQHIFQRLPFAANKSYASWMPIPINIPADFTDLRKKHSIILFVKEKYVFLHKIFYQYNKQNYIL